MQLIKQYYGTAMLLYGGYNLYKTFHQNAPSMTSRENDSSNQSKNLLDSNLALGAWSALAALSASLIDARLPCTFFKCSLLVGLQNIATHPTVLKTITKASTYFKQNENPGAPTSPSKTLEKCVNTTFAVADIALGLFLLSSPEFEFSWLANLNCAANLYGEEILSFDPEDPRDKFLILESMENEKIERKLEVMEPLITYFDTKIANVRDGYEIALEVCDAAKAGKLKGLLLQVHGSREPKNLDSLGFQYPTIKEGLFGLYLENMNDDVRTDLVNCLSPNTTVILQTCYGAESAQSLSKQTGTRVYSSDQAIPLYFGFHVENIDPIHVSLKNWNGEDITKVFLNGEIVESTTNVTKSEIIKDHVLGNLKLFNYY